MLIYFEDILNWKHEGNDYVAYADERKITIIISHYITGIPCMTWFEYQNDECDNSITGSVEFLKERAQTLWTNYLQKLQNGIIV